MRRALPGQMTFSPALYRPLRSVEVSSGWLRRAKVRAKLRLEADYRVANSPRETSRSVRTFACGARGSALLPGRFIHEITRSLRLPEQIRGQYRVPRGGCRDRAGLMSWCDRSAG